MDYLSNIWYVGDWNPARYDSYNNYMKKFEIRLKQNYPLGKDSFSIDHGKNYFTFFRRLGEPFYYAIFDHHDNVIGTVCYVYRKMLGENIMYLCDLKFDPKIRNKGMMNKMLYRTIPTCLMRTKQFYAISMNEDSINNNIIDNKILSMGQHLGRKNNIDINSGGVLNIYLLDFTTMLYVHSLVLFLKGKSCSLNTSEIRYISLKDIKDLIVKNSETSNESSLDLLHLHYVDATNINDDITTNVNDKLFKSDYPVENHTHMFCTLSNSELATDLAHYDIYPSSTATIIHHDMNTFNWELIQTCDI